MERSTPLKRVPSSVRLQKLVDSFAEIDEKAGPDHAGLQIKIVKIAKCLLAQNNYKEIRRLFRKYDTRFYGYITVPQFRAILNDATLEHLNLTDEEKDLIVSYCDAEDTEDGKIEYKEFFSTFFFYLKKAAKIEKSGLRQIFVLTRHGARFPLNPCPLNTAWPSNEFFWKNYKGKITPEGISQHVHLGKMVRQKYLDQLGLLECDFAFPERVHVFTSNTDRTIFSASSFLKGLAPTISQSYAVDNEESPQTRHYQGIRIHISDTSKPYMPSLHGYKENPKFERLKNEALKSAPFFHEVAKDKEYLDFLDKMWQMTGHSSIEPSDDIVNRFRRFNPLASQMEIERSLQMPLFANLKGLMLNEDDEKKAVLLSDKHKLIKYTGNSDEDHVELARCAAGLLPQHICSYFNARIGNIQNRYSKKKIVLYSAHDNTIMALLSQMGFREWTIPNFAAAVIIELHLIGGKHYVAIKYTHDPTPLSDLNDLKSHKMPVGGGHVDFSNADEGMHPFEEFEDYLMNTRKSYRTEEEWRAEAGPVDPSKHKKDDGGD